MKRSVLFSAPFAPLALAVAAGACGGSSDMGGDAGAPDGGAQGMVTPAPDGKPWSTLDAWHLFTDPVAQTPAEGVIPYQVVSPLFSDYTTKYRFLWVPPGKKITYHDKDRWDLPVGAVFVKTFAYLADVRDPKKGQRLMETRLLVHEAGGWKPHTYEWDAAQKTATLKVAGDMVDVSWIDANGATQTNTYAVPNTNVCLECHGKVGLTGPLASRTRQWNRDGEDGNNQIDHLVSLGLLDVTPPAAAMRQTLVDPFGSGTPSDRGRSYLDANCGHCHGVVGLAKGTAFWLDWDHTDPVTGNPSDWGVCKVPASAGGGTCGLGFDVVPGHSDQSIVPCRVGTLESKVAMPPVGHDMVHAEGVTLLKTWIDAMPEMTCQ